MANRILRDWTDSERVNTISVHAERFFTRLIMKVDDFGCYTANTKLIKSTLFPLLIDEVREADISRWMDECQKAGLILFYEVSNKNYIQIVDFKQRLRQAKGKYPPPIGGQLSVNCRLETKRNEEETETKYANDLTNENPGLVKKASDLIEAVCEYFDVKTIVASVLYNSVCDFVSTLGHRNQLDIAAIALKNYMAYKAKSQEQKHNISKWIGTKENHYQDGQWIMIDWDTKFKRYEERNKNSKSNQYEKGKFVA